MKVSRLSRILLWTIKTLFPAIRYRGESVGAMMDRHYEIGLQQGAILVPTLAIIIFVIINL